MMNLAEASHALEQALKPMFGDSIKVMHQLGIMVTYETETEDEYTKKQWQTYYSDSKPHVSVQVGIIPAGDGKFYLKLMNSSNQVDTLKALGITFRRSTVPTLEKAVESVVKWFKASKPKLEGAAKTASMAVRVAALFGRTGRF